MNKKLEIKDIMEKGHLIKNKEQAIDLIDKVLKKHSNIIPISASYLLSDIKYWLETEKRIKKKILKILETEHKFIADNPFFQYIYKISELIEKESNDV